MPLDESVIAATSNYNYKANVERATQNMDAHQHRLQLLAEASIAQQLNRMNSLDPTEAAAIAKVTNADMAQKVAGLAAAVASSQQLMKGAITTPPETGQG